MSDVLTGLVDGGVLTLTLQRPAQLNAVNRELADALAAALDEASTNADIFAVVLRGSGAAFCAGGDIGDLAHGTMFPAAADRAAKVALLRAQMRSIEHLAGMGKITIAEIGGACAGAGLSLAAACDLRICGDSAVFSTAFLTVGLSGDYGGTWTISRALGAAKARELFLLSPKFDAATALRMGFVSAVHPSADLPAAAQALARRFAKVSPAALTAMKANLNEALTLPLDALLDAEAERQIRCLESEAVQTAAKAFLQRRQAVSESRS